MIIAGASHEVRRLGLRLGGGVSRSPNADIASDYVLGELCGKPVPHKPTSAWVLKALGMVGNWASFFTGKAPTLTPEAASMVTRSLFCDCGKAARELGYQTIPLRAMAEGCYHWLKQEGLLAGRRHRSGQGTSA